MNNQFELSLINKNLERQAEALHSMELSTDEIESAIASFNETLDETNDKLDELCDALNQINETLKGIK